ncbi:hypothetical protein [Polaromonas sp. UC242_47]|uniref:hypothetical protein n=1 Tax=Polaromonas sp. UC242_47 TaxID=3374626 RepID=UPI003791A903
MKYAIAVLALAFIGIATPAESFAKGKGGHYAGGKGSSHKGGSYVSPKGSRYKK